MVLLLRLMFKIRSGDLKIGSSIGILLNFPFSYDSAIVLEHVLASSILPIISTVTKNKIDFIRFKPS